MTPAPGKTPKRHIASEIAGFVCPPEALPGGLTISPARSNATAAPTIQSSAWIPGIACEIGEGPITHLTIVATAKSRIEVRINSIALSRASRTIARRSAVFGSDGDCSTLLLLWTQGSRVKPGVKKRSNRSPVPIETLRGVQALAMRPRRGVWNIHSASLLQRVTRGCNNLRNGPSEPNRVQRATGAGPTG